MRPQQHRTDNTAIGARAGPALLRSGWVRAGVILLTGVGLALLLSLDAVHAWLQDVLVATGPWIQAHPVIGPLGFVLLAALSAMLAFVSSTALVPLAVFNWGRWATMLLLWLGWMLGGVCAYAIGRWLGAPLLRARRRTSRLAAWQQRVSTATGFPEMLLLQLVLPSELPGYLSGLLRIRFGIYFPALALAELPYAVGTVLIGEGIVRGQGFAVIALTALAAVAALLAAWLLQRKLRGR